jgi:hypothetical protein
VTRVSLAPRGARTLVAPQAAPQPLLEPRGAEIILGNNDAAAPIIPAADTLFGPRGACLAGAPGPLVVCDTGHHRLLIWTRVPQSDNVPADLLIGQTDFGREGRNARGAVGANTLNVPTGVAYGDGVLAVADAWNHRVLLWHGFPKVSDRPADVVLGQADFQSERANRGLPAPRADTLHWCYGVTIDRGRLLVADTGNRRVLMWDAIPTTHGQPADLVMGQPDFITRDDNADLGGGAVGMRWPHGIAFAGDALLIADAGLNRVMVWSGVPKHNGGPCEAVLGQADFNGHDHNRAGYNPGAATFNMPYGVTVRDRSVIVADTANSRLLGFATDGLATGCPAVALAAQNTFNDKGDNRWNPAVRDSLCWPYAVSHCNNTIVVADSGNNRVLLWQAATL